MHITFLIGFALFSVNVGLLPTADNKLARPEMWSVEVAPNSEHNHSLLDTKQIDTTYYHMNKCAFNKIWIILFSRFL